MKQDMIVIIDLGSEENAKLARDIRSLGVYSEIHNFDIIKVYIPNKNFKFVIDGTETVTRCLLEYFLQETDTLPAFAMQRSAV